MGTDGFSVYWKGAKPPAGDCAEQGCASAVSLLVLRAPPNNPRGLLTRSALEWQKDRLLLDELLAPKDSNPERAIRNK